MDNFDDSQRHQASQVLNNSGLQQQYTPVPNIPVIEQCENIQGPVLLQQYIPIHPIPVIECYGNMQVTVFQQQMFPIPFMHFQQYRQVKPASGGSVSCNKDNRDEGQLPKKRVVCNVCHKSLASEITLQRHSVIHTGQFSFVCETCEKGFTDLSSFKRHKLLHTGEKPHVCPICPLRFVQKVNLTDHIRTHTGEKPFVCEVCNKRFAQKGNLRSHRKTHQNNHLYNHKIFQPASNNIGTLNKKRG